MMSRSNQKNKLIFQLTREILECMICCAKIRRKHHTWCCPVCFNVFHLECIKKWGNSSLESSGWRCPGCQSLNAAVPHLYTCFCGKITNPSSRYRDITPHSCGNTCGRVGSGGDGCTHGCPDPCHPGRCNKCLAQVLRYCPCGKTSYRITCSSKKLVLCGNECGKPLNCGVHHCARKCHEGSCGPCGAIVHMNCYCGKSSKIELCTAETKNEEWFSCGQKCGRILKCGNHKCEQICHPQCSPCELSPSQTRYCPCGQTGIDDICKAKRLPPRSSCLDPIPTCGKVCLKPLMCGPEGDPHLCQLNCHLKGCPPCPSVTEVKCRCMNKTTEVPCKDLATTGEILCSKKCTKKRSCGRHKCNTVCCIDKDHICPIVCDRMLPCGNHHCELLCHNGHCPPCPILSFEELTCECGNSVLYPPISCGTKPPECSRPCTRQHDCDHAVHHTCHSEPECPPCYVLTSKWCHGGHMLRQNILCHIKEVSCGLPCDKMLKCSRHRCPKKCHPNECMKEEEICKLPCAIPRPRCGHNCNAPCHEGPCPDTKCKESTEITCMCGRLTESIVCWKREMEYEKLVESLFSKKMDQLKVDGVTETDTDQIKLEVVESRNKFQLLKCDKECARIERNKKLAEALQLEDPDVSTQFGVPSYSDYMKKMAQKNPRFVETVHEKLADLVKKVKKLKSQKNLTYQFEGLNRDKRQLIFEYCEHFGCLYNSVDEGEPGLKSAIITASKDKSFVPSVSLVSAVFQQTVRAERRTANADVELSTDFVRAEVLQHLHTTSVFTALQAPSSLSVVNIPTDFLRLQ